MSNNEPETQNSSGTGKLPLRGFAMVLIAVAVALALWALYSVTQGGDDSDTADTAAETPATAGNGNGSAPQSGDPAQPDAGGAGGDAAASDSPAPSDAPEDAQPGERQGDGRTGDDAAGNDAADDGAAGSGDGEQPEGDAAPGGNTAAASGGTGAPVEPARLHVLNNSTVSDLAADVSQRLDEEGYELGEVGNFADEIFPETTVFFTPGNAAAEEEAHQLASRLNGVAREHVESLPPETEDPEDITLVLIGEVAL